MPSPVAEAEVVLRDGSTVHVVVCGGGGTTAELIGDVAVRLTPVTDGVARDMMRSLRTSPLVSGYRGAAPADVGALEDVVLRFAAMVDEHDEIAEVDLNPVIVSASGAWWSTPACAWRRHRGSGPGPRSVREGVSQWPCL